MKPFAGILGHHNEFYAETESVIMKTLYHTAANNATSLNEENGLTYKFVRFNQQPVPFVVYDENVKQSSSTVVGEVGPTRQLW